MVIPPAAALLLASRLWSVFAASVGIAAFSAAFGYYFSFLWSLPTGATMVVEAIRVAMNLAIRNPRIDERVQDVDHEVQRGDGKGIQQRRAHDQ